MANNRNTKSKSNNSGKKTPLWSSILVLAIAAFVVFGYFGGCNGKIGNLNINGNTNGNTPVATQPANTSNTPGTNTAPAQNTAVPAPAPTNAAPGAVIAGSGDYAATQWSPEIAPNAYRVAGEAIVNYDVAPGEYHYSDLDQMQRPGVCYAGITPQNYRDELDQEREKLPKQITGWHKSVQLPVQYPGTTSDKNVQILQRSHRLADSLGGEGTIRNLITASSYENIGQDNKGGMCYTEELARNWLASAPNDAWLYYCVTPVYGEGDLIPRSSYVDILSSDGTINQHVEVYNVIGDIQNRYYFNYATGEVIEAATGKPVS